MFGGTANGESSTHTHVTSTGTKPRLLGRPARAALVATVLIALTLALALPSGPSSDAAAGPFVELRRLLLITGGAMVFGAGLLQVATWRVSHVAAQAVRGLALGSTGLTLTFLAGLGGTWLNGSTVGVPTFHLGFATAVLVAGSSLVAFSVALAGFLAVAAQEEERLSSVEMALHAAALATEARNEEQRDLRHDARTALCALRMATQALAEVGDRLDQETRQGLRRSVLEEVGHLDELISRTTSTPPDVPRFAKERQPLVPQQRPRRATKQDALVGRG